MGASLAPAQLVIQIDRIPGLVQAQGGTGSGSRTSTEGHRLKVQDDGRAVRDLAVFEGFGIGCSVDVGCGEPVQLTEIGEVGRDALGHGRIVWWRTGCPSDAVNVAGRRVVCP